MRASPRPYDECPFEHHERPKWWHKKLAAVRHRVQKMHSKGRPVEISHLLKSVYSSDGYTDDEILYFNLPPRNYMQRLLSQPHPFWQLIKKEPKQHA